MDIDVNIDKQPDGFVLLTVDEFKDILAGPYVSVEDCLESAIELSLHVLNSDKYKVTKLGPARGNTLKSLDVGCLLRIENGWYRKLSNDGSNTVLSVVGQIDKTIKMPGSTRAAQISVLNLH